MYLFEASALPVEVDPNAIGEDALQAAFALIAQRLADEGYPVTGDFAPEETQRLKDLFVSFVQRMALNNPAIAALNEDEDEDPHCVDCGKQLGDYDLQSNDPTRCDSCETQAHYDRLSDPRAELLHRHPEASHVTRETLPTGTVVYSVWASRTADDPWLVYGEDDLSPDYRVTGIEACEPTALPIPTNGVKVTRDEQGEHHGFDTVTVSGPTAEAVLDYVRANWGDGSDGGDADWFAEYIVARLEGPTEAGAQPTVYLVIGPSAIAFDERGEILETVDWDPVTGKADWTNAGICDHRGGGGPEGYKALHTALNAAEANARLCGFPITRVVTDWEGVGREDH